MSVNNNVYKLMVGDLVERITWDSYAKKMGIVVALGSDLPYDDAGDRLVEVLWQGDYGTNWARPEKLKLIAKGKK